MNFLAVDTSGKYMSVIAYAQGKAYQRFLPDCALKHSVLLMQEIDAALKLANITPKDCDFFAAVSGPGSFTGIRIGLSTVKGMCVALEKPALSVTAFDTLAYAEGSTPLLTLVDAGHDCFYACGYDQEKNVAFESAFLSHGEVDRLIASGFTPVAAAPLFEGCRVANPCEGMLAAVLKKQTELVNPSALSALYLRKSSAEENRV